VDHDGTATNAVAETTVVACRVLLFPFLLFCYYFTASTTASRVEEKKQEKNVE
jgi:hypothetical protein